MRRSLILVLFCLLNFVVYAKNVPYYLDFTYLSGNFLIPEDSEWLKILKESNRSLTAVLTVFKKDKDSENISVSPVVVEVLTVKNGNIASSSIENVPLLRSYFVNPGAHVKLKVEFLFLENNHLSVLIDSFKSIRAARVKSKEMRCSNFVASVAELVFNVVVPDKSFYFNYMNTLGDIQEDFELFFGKDGRVYKAMPNNYYASLKFLTKKFVKDVASFETGFEAQVYDSGVLNLFNDFRNAYGNKDKLGLSGVQQKCEALRKELERNNTRAAAKDFLAIAINDIGWPQDETKFHCLNPNDALRYQRENGLKKIVNCGGDFCLRTKKILLGLLGVPNPIKELNSSRFMDLAGGVNLLKFRCFSEIKDIRSFDGWSTIYKDYKKSSPGVEVYSFGACMNVGGQQKSYDHIISWSEGEVVGHFCTPSRELEKACENK